MGPLNDEDEAARASSAQSDIKYKVDWTTLGEYLEQLEKQGISLERRLVRRRGHGAHARARRRRRRSRRRSSSTQMRALVQQAMEEGALGVGSSLIYRAGHLCQDAGAGRAGGGSAAAAAASTSRTCAAKATSCSRRWTRLIDISREAQRAGRDLSPESRRASRTGEAGPSDRQDRRGARAWVCASPPTCTPTTAGATGLDAAMPPWVQDGGLEKWIARLKDPAIAQARHRRDARSAYADWDNLYRWRGAEGTLLLGFKNPTS